MRHPLLIAVLPLFLTACGGGSGSGSGGSDPSAYSPTAPGAGSTVSSAESTGSIKYAQYQQGAILMTATNFSVPSVTAAVNFTSASKQGSIQFPVMGANELISTGDAYATSRWSGPFLTGLYKFKGNILLGCYANAANDAEKTQVFVSSSLARVKDGFIDDMNGTTFDLIDCPILEKGRTETLTLNNDGTMFLSTANATIPKNQVFDMLNPEKGFGGALINGSDYASKGSYSGQAFKYGENGVTKYAIVIQTSAGNTTPGASYHYLLAIQR